MSNRIKQVMWIGLMLIGLLRPSTSRAQTHEITQLILNYEKLTQLEKILENMYEGYTILNKGYSSVKNIAEGNFKLHEAFLNELLQVSPQVRNYYRVAAIIQYQQRILGEYKSTYSWLKNEGFFSVDELAYLGDVYEGLFKASFRNLDELAMILTAGELRMSDFERLEAIDRLHTEMSGLLVNLRQLNGEVATLNNQRKRKEIEREFVLKLNGLNP
ncbi:TerB family tellurite resistance protein [Algoriphagus aquimarinus]|uniref:TerB family tellurite resistance protein n=1 Tax=Algoriphagus aquimarinus TaxID=237018 RepID=UPI0030DD977A|tara:strand:- start:2118 stop:2765 length:648 start_codon:yes stop_codon:yes gene_type:complete